MEFDIKDDMDVVVSPEIGIEEQPTYPWSSPRSSASHSGNGRQFELEVKPYYPAFKRSFDVSISLLGTLLVLPVLTIIAILIKLDSRGPVFFRQVRVGLGARRFRIFKFRTMVANAAENGTAVTIRNDSRITRVGRFLRRFKLDELPQLLNVLVGDMSLVGPRPEVPKYIDFYTRVERTVLRAKPGITDLASIYYRNESELLAGTDDVDRFYVERILHSKLRLNLEYLRRFKFWLDVKIIFLTVAVSFLPALFEREVKRHIEANYL